MKLRETAIEAVPLPYPITDRFDLETALTYLRDQVASPAELWALVTGNFAVDLDLMAEAMAQLFPAE